MTNALVRRTAQAITADRLAAAARRRQAASLAQALRGGSDAAGRQRSLVRLSLLGKRRSDTADARSEL